ncbi:MAG: type secretion system protein GspD, partial [Pseudomonadota bacterium]
TKPLGLLRLKPHNLLIGTLFNGICIDGVNGAQVTGNEVIALGGLFKNAQSFDKNGLPILSRIPILGGLLFGNTSRTQRRTELIVLIKPHVLRTPDDLSAITEEMRAKISTLEPFRTKGRIP